MGLAVPIWGKMLIDKWSSIRNNKNESIIDVVRQKESVDL